MKNLIYTILIIVGFSFASCEENDRLLFKSEDTAVSFNFSSEEKIIKDTIYSYNFAYLNKQEETINLPFKLQGVPVDYDRPIQLKVIETDTINNAIEGVHFKFDRNSLFVPKNEVYASVPITFYSTDDLQDTIVTIQFRLEGNDYLLKGAQEECHLDITLNNNFKVLPQFWSTFKLGNSYIGFGRSDEVIVRKYCELGNITSSAWVPRPRTMYKILINKTKDWFNANPTEGDDGEIIKF